MEGEEQNTQLGCSINPNSKLQSSKERSSHDGEQGKNFSKLDGLIDDLGKGPRSAWIILVRENGINTSEAQMEVFSFSIRGSRTYLQPLNLKRVIVEVGKLGCLRFIEIKSLKEKKKDRKG